ncbi:replication-relaxation family protein [Tepidibacter thalassicus]|uniref:Replication-relaxation n=1 Tax=Tepidibacter thalassicus DSM 15285 TaxID=1123350 RepID=A0A1M5PVG6_9FIRM|nr:replication-relaxation family protein [Tepidibacter thalassicus]SHH05616.1 Replication-relaxation [Tepidibacter thalassicus DSM 15285]
MSAKIQDRDLKVINFIEKVGVATTNQIYQMFFSNRTDRVCYRRLNRLVQEKKLKRFRENQISEYKYYIKKKPVNIRHGVLRTEFYVQLSKLFNIKHFKKEFEINNIRSDALFGIENKKTQKKFLLFLEVEISNNNLKKKLKKYEGLKISKKYKGKLPVFPILIILSNKQKIDTKLNYIQIKTDFSNMKDLYFQFR